DQHASLRGLISTWLEIAVNALLSLEQDEGRRIWVILDELPTLHQVPSLQPGLAESRQFGGCFVLGVQVASALRDLYGRNGAETISGLCGTRVVLAAPDRDTAQWSADSLGRSEVEEVAEGFSYGANTIRDGVSLTPRRELRALALPSEIMRLKNLSGYLKFPGPFPVASIRLRYVKRPAAAARFVPREGDEAEAEDRADGAVPAARADADNAAETGVRAAPGPGKRGKAPRDNGGVARDTPPEPAALQEVLALPPPEGSRAEAAAQAGGMPGRKGGRKAQRAERKSGENARRAESRDAAKVPDGIPQDRTGEALPSEGPADTAVGIPTSSGDGDWG
ncbi:MAG: type IV secretion system DNA-binding domain-containing protein, partial [Gammaproteobacteria bacterium]|nr:type IV secretion system DNA-binding domain-containing protein [Gammaproteobacteria bacterium]